MTGELHLTLEKARELVGLAIEERGEDFIYRKQKGKDCFYVHTNEVWDDETETYVQAETGQVPGCIVGLALNKAGVSLNDMLPSEGQPANWLIADLRSKDIILTAEDEAITYLDDAQACQDEGGTWAEAQRSAEKALEPEPECECCN